MDPINPVSPIPYMGRDQARKRLEYHREKRKREAEKKKQEKNLKDWWEEKKK